MGVEEKKGNSAMQIDMYIQYMCIHFVTVFLAIFITEVSKNGFILIQNLARLKG